VVLPIHNLAFLDRADHIVCLADKRVAEQGTYKDLVASGGAFSKIMEEFSAKQEEEGEAPEAAAAAAATPGGDSPAAAVKSDGKMMETEERERGGPLRRGPSVIVPAPFSFVWIIPI
jgi:ATP-binding cassette subfamily C (CFTR/MRP) protein 1